MPTSRPASLAPFRIFGLHRWCILLLALTLVGASLDVTPTARAASIVVDTLADAVDAGTCNTLASTNLPGPDDRISLREAICVANSTPGADTIMFRAGLSGTIALTAGELVVDAETTIDGPGSDLLAISGENRSRGLNIRGGPVTLSGMTIKNGTHTSGGGGLFINYSTATLNDITVTGNAAPSGGGIFIGAGQLTVNDSTIEANASEASEGGNGGGIHVGGSIEYGSAVLRVNRSTISDNRASLQGGGIEVNSGAVTIRESVLHGNSAKTGGGISVDGSRGVRGSLDLVNSTLSANMAVDGGGIYAYNISAYQGTAVTTDHTTIAHNSASSRGSGILVLGNLSTVTMRSTILAAGGVSANCAMSSQGTLTSEGHNLDDGTSCALSNVDGNQSSADPRLGALADNGGTTHSHALLSGSPAIDAGGRAACPGTDQRGVIRPAGIACDIGAFEYQPPLTSPSPLPTPSPILSPSSSPLPTPSPIPSPSGPSSPAPSFADVLPGYWAYDQIGLFAQRAITNGCGDDDQGRRLFCPERGVTRAEMAVFLTRALGQTGKDLPATPTFADVPADHWAYGQIETFLRLGITTGCGNDSVGNRLFCPDRGLTRAEMAAFLSRMKNQPEFIGGAPTFADVPPDYWAFGWIERIFALDITTGCGTDDQSRTIYCPDRSVTRAEIAVFVIRTYP